MISRISGILLEKNPLSVLIDVQGVGYKIDVSLSTCEKLGKVGEVVVLLTYLHVREDILQLFGFATAIEKQLFVNLISVNGVGPKMAQKILSGCDVESFCQYIAQNDVSALSKIPGIGKKTAENLIYQLSERLSKFKMNGETVNNKNNKPDKDDAISVLVSLGYNKTIAKSAVEKALNENGDLNIDELIKTSLRYI